MRSYSIYIFLLPSVLPHTDEGLMSYLQMYSTGGVLCVVLVGYGLGVKTVLVSGCFGAECSVVPAREQQLKERVSWV